jgi:L-lactate dehydrogenase (cytochrome)
MGKEGVSLALSILRKEMDVTMALCGKRDIKDVNSSIIAGRQ